MALVAHSGLPTYTRLRQEGHQVISYEVAQHQDIRELHIGFLNMMPDAALEATERQFFRLIGSCNQIVQFYIHPFSIDGVPRGEKGRVHIDKYYESFSKIQEQGLDALIISGANVTQPKLEQEDFWEPLTEVFNWAQKNVASILCSCLATHALVQYEYGIQRTRLPQKKWGVFSHRVIERWHPLVSNINTRLNLPHSRYNEIFSDDFEKAGLRVLIKSDDAGVHLAVSEDFISVVYLQGHPEYDMISLLKEYKRECVLFFSGMREEYPVYPENYFTPEAKDILVRYENLLVSAKNSGQVAPEFPEAEIIPCLDNTWRDSAKAVINNWLGKVYQITNQEHQIILKNNQD
ncbi:MAG: homoserine O-succinyltransferase [Gammaproteobacteria bacterium]|nr:homoserine O-succinyltransferase [Gammaproteobacteria bacterium]